MKIAVIGTGYVGITTAASLGELGHKVIGVDVDQRKIAALRKGRLPIFEPGVEPIIQQMLEKGTLSFTTSIKEAVELSEVVFIAVGTPPLPDGKPNLSYIDTVAESIGKNIQSYIVVVNKSTVPVGTAERVEKIIEQVLIQRDIKIDFDVVSNPEFLKEGKALEDARNPDRIVIGCNSKLAEEKMLTLYKDVAASKLITTPRNAEMIKYASNAFLATKISFINELARLCDKVSVDVTEVSKGMGLDKRIGPQFLQAGIGYGGSCFPKDVAALSALGRDQGVELSIIQRVQEVNNTQIEWFINKLEGKIGELRGKKIALLGLSFKPQTDDLREAPSLKLIAQLVQKGAKIQAYDPIVRGTLDDPDVLVTEDVESAVSGADGLLLCTEWEEFLELNWEEVKRRMEGNYVFDARNALNAKQLHAIGFQYIGVGRSMN